LKVKRRHPMKVLEESMRENDSVLRGLNTGSKKVHENSKHNKDNKSNDSNKAGCKGCRFLETVRRAWFPPWECWHPRKSKRTPVRVDLDRYLEGCSGKLN